MDAYALVEAAARARVARLGTEPSADLAKNLKQISAAKASPTYSKVDRTSVNSAILSLEELREVRCDIAHGTMDTVVLNGQELACFRNAQKIGPTSTEARLMTLAQLREAKKQLGEIAKTIDPSKP